MSILKLYDVPTENQANVPQQQSKKQSFHSQLQQKQIFKIKKSPNDKQLLLRPNGNIIIVNVEKGKFGMMKECLLYLNCKNHISIPRDFSQGDSTLYKGGLDSFHFLPIGKGVFINGNEQFEGQFKEGFAYDLCKLTNNETKSIIQCKYQWGQKHGPYQEMVEDQLILGQYDNNLKQGLFITQTYNQGKLISEEKKYYKNGIRMKQQDINHNSQQTQTTRYLLSHKVFSLTNFSFKGFNYGEWLNQLGLDYYIQLVDDYYQVAFNKQIYLINTVECQDIFSSLITSKEQKPLILPRVLEIVSRLSEIKKLILVMNVDRGHFLTLVYQNQVLNILNSLTSSSDNIILDKVSKIFPWFNNTNQYQQQVIIPVQQQNNGFDCGIHTIYNTLMQYKHIDKNVKDINYSTSPINMELLRRHIKNVLINDYAHILPSFQ